LREHIFRQHPKILTETDADLQKHLDESRNSEKHFEEKYRPKSVEHVPSPDPVPEIGAIPVAIPPQHPVYLQIGGLQYQALQLLPMPGEHGATYYVIWSKSEMTNI
jgi:hypothetical protein